MGKNTFSLKNKLTKLLKEFYPQLTIRVYFKPKLVIKDLFKFKDVIPLELQSSVVYRYDCHCCKAMYVGKTKRQLRVRYFEHCGRSVRTNKPLGKPPFSAIRQHSHECDHNINFSSFSVLSSRASEMELNIVESLHTIRDRPSLGSHERSVDLLCF